MLDKTSTIEKERESYKYKFQINLLFIKEINGEVEIWHEWIFSPTYLYFMCVFWFDSALAWIKDTVIDYFDYAPMNRFYIKLS